MKLREFYEKPLRQGVEKMNLIDVKIYPDADGEVQTVLLKYAPRHDSGVLCIPPGETAPEPESANATVTKQEALSAYNLLKQYCGEQKDFCEGCLLFCKDGWGCATQHRHAPQRWQDLKL